jgi:hypothetical protein
MDEPTPEAEVDEIMWIPELKAWRIPRFGYRDEALCSMHGVVDWWLVLRAEDGLIVGWGRDVEPPKKGSNEPSDAGRLFERPMLLTESDAESFPFGGLMRKADAEKARNLAKRKPVVIGVQLNLF